VKPYNECTKYSDTLVRNKQLLRRGQFDLPVDYVLVAEWTNPVIKGTDRCFRSQKVRKSKTEVKITSETTEMNESSKKDNEPKKGFDKVVVQHYSCYPSLSSRGALSLKEQIQFKNSMNRILDAEMISYRLANTGHSMPTPQHARTKR
jgi:hypothetical protein